MRESQTPADAPDTAGRPAARRYRVEVLVAPVLGPDGIEHRRDGRPGRLAWRDVEAAVAAEVGEPQGVRTIVFDLVRREGADLVAARLDAEPGEEAAALARTLHARLGEAAGPSIKSLASDGLPSRWYPDLVSFEQEALALLG